MSDIKTKHIECVSDINATADKFNIYKQIAENAISIEIIRDKTGSIVFINKAASVLSGYTLDELKQLTIKQLTHPKDYDRIKLAFDNAYIKHHSVTDLNYRIIIKDGSVKHLSLSATPIYNDNNEFIGVHEHIKDITEGIELSDKITKLKELEQKLISKNNEYSKLNNDNRHNILRLENLQQESKINLEKLKEAQRISKTASWELYVRNHTINWSDEIYEILEISKTQLGNSFDSLTSYIHPDDRTLAINIKNETIFHKKEKCYFTHRVITSNNNIKHIEVRIHSRINNEGNVTMLYGTWSDITERILIENDLKEAKAAAENLAYELEESKRFYKDKLDLILSPYSNLDNLHITDIIDVRQLQLIQDSFVEATGVASIITDIKGNPITKASEFSKVCQLVRQTEKGRENCFNSDKIIGQKAIENNQPYYEKCHSCGFVDAGTPIIIGDKPIAIWMIGQVSFGKPDKDSLLSYIEEIGADKEAIYSEIDTLKNTTPEKFEKIVHFLSILAKEISNLAHTNLVLAKKVEEQKKTQNELRLAKKHSEESDKLKTAFLHNLSHEIRTPMNAIVGFSEMIKLPDNTKDSRNRYADYIINNSKQLLSIVNDILIMSTLETNQEEINNSKVCLNQYLADTTEIFKATYENKEVSLEFSKTSPNEDACIFIDKTKLEHIVTRLLNNAYKYTDKGKIVLGYQINNDTILFSIKDSGIGIKQEKLDKIFERFSNADNSITTEYGGTGLGLAIAKGFVELLGGEIWAESKPNQGSEFYFTTPYNPAMQKPILTKSTDFNAVITPKTILVAEDQEYNFIYLEELLKRMDVTIMHAKNGQEAINMANSGQSIDLILMDIKMPIIDGHTAALEIKKKNPQIPIIAQSAFALDHEKKRFEGDAFDDYIVKAY